MNAIEAIGGSLPLAAEEFARRAYEYALKPNRNPLKEVLDQADSVETTPPLLGIFNDIPWHGFREIEAHAWAKAGFSWIVNDAEHSQWEGWYGREQNAAECRLGLLPIQRLHRAARSSYGDVYQLGARASMRPYGTTYEDAEACELPRSRQRHTGRPRRLPRAKRGSNDDVHARGPAKRRNRNTGLDTI